MRAAQAAAAALPRSSQSRSWEVTLADNPGKAVQVEPMKSALKAP
jgi:hypothetical protein